jgi:hypothetical protein
MSDIDRDTARKLAKMTRKGDLPGEFMAYAFYVYKLGFVTKDGIVIHPIELPKGKVIITLLVDDKTSIRQIEKSWWEIKKWQTALTEWQGPTPNAEQRLFASLQKLISEQNKKGVSYAKLAQKVNQLIIELLTEYAGWLNDSAEYTEWVNSSIENSISKSAIKMKKTSQGDMSSWFHDYLAKPDHNDPGAMFTAELILKLFRPRFSDNERKDTLQDALHNIQNDKMPFIHNEPVRPRDIRERIDYWRSKQRGVGKTS